jgi:hypothetical protein
VPGTTSRTALSASSNQDGIQDPFFLPDVVKNWYKRDVAEESPAAQEKRLRDDLMFARARIAFLADASKSDAAPKYQETDPKYALSPMEELWSIGQAPGSITMSESVAVQLQRKYKEVAKLEAQVARFSLSPVEVREAVAA